MVGLQEVRGVGVSHSLLQDRQTDYVQAAGAHISPAAHCKIQHVLILQCTRVCLFGGFLQGGFLTQVHQCEEIWKEFKLLFHSHGSYVKSLGAFMGVMTRLPTSEANSGVAASPMCMVNIHQSRAILQRSGNQVLHRSSRKHLMCWNKDSSEFCGRWSGVGLWLEGEAEFRNWSRVEFQIGGGVKYRNAEMWNRASPDSQRQGGGRYVGNPSVDSNETNSYYLLTLSDLREPRLSKW